MVISLETQSDRDLFNAMTSYYRSQYKHKMFSKAFTKEYHIKNSDKNTEFLALSAKSEVRKVLMNYNMLPPLCLIQAGFHPPYLAILSGTPLSRLEESFML